jgi:hypothetical protein
MAVKREGRVFVVWRASQMDVQSDMEMMEMETEIRGPTTAHGTLVDAANGLHRGPLCCTSCRSNWVYGDSQPAVWCGRPRWLGMREVSYSEAEESSKRRRRRVMCSAACQQPRSLHSFLLLEALFIRCARRRHRRASWASSRPAAAPAANRWQS